MNGESDSGGRTTTLGKTIIVKTTFLVMSLGGITVIWNLPRPFSDISILLGIAWIFFTSRILRWFFIRMGWTTKEREGILFK